MHKLNRLEGGYEIIMDAINIVYKEAVGIESK